MEVSKEEERGTCSFGIRRYKIVNSKLLVMEYISEEFVDKDESKKWAEFPTPNLLNSKFLRLAQNIFVSNFYSLRKG